MTILIDTERLAASPKQAARKVTDLFGRAGLEVIDVSTDSKVRRESGVSYREVVLHFADSQRLSMRVKLTGDVYQVRINDKVVPVAAQDEPAKAVAELVKRLDTGRSKFQKRLAAMQMKPPEAMRTAAPKLESQLREQIAVVETEINAATEELAALQAE